MKLAALAKPLREAGLRTVNVSLDALDPEIYHRITGGDVARVLAGIRAAVDAGFERVKLNCVLMRGVNEAESGRWSCSPPNTACRCGSLN
jgi:cyclic pyranopterin phosphate synthase